MSLNILIDTIFVGQWIGPLLSNRNSSFPNNVPNFIIGDAIKLVLFFHRCKIVKKKLLYQNYDDLPFIRFCILDFFSRELLLFWELKEILWRLQQYSYHLL
jgi:hypothetical protein